MTVDFLRAICSSWLPAYKRQPNRMQMLRSFVLPLQQLFEEYLLWRQHQWKMAHFSCQTKILENYLNVKYGATNITILSRDTTYVAIGLQAEGESYWLSIGVNVNETPTATFPLLSDNSSNFDVDFICYAPISINLDMLTADIEHYKLANMTFKIIQK